MTGIGRSALIPRWMDAATLEQVRSLWPDVALPFSRVVPDGCVLTQAIDDWRVGLRARTIKLLRGEHSPDLDALLEEAREDAERRGWTPHDDGGEEGVYELESVILHLTRARLRGQPVLLARFEQPWPKDAGAPVETSETFQKMTREALGLGGEPLSLSKELIVDPLDIARVDSLKETVELPLDRELIHRFPKIGFTFDEQLEAWKMGSLFGDYQLAAHVKETFDRVRVEVSKTRLRH